MAGDDREKRPPDDMEAEAPGRLSDRIELAAQIEAEPVLVLEDAGEPFRRVDAVATAGKMLLGQRMAAPNVAMAPQAFPFKQNEVFSSTRYRRRRELSGGTAIIFVCTLAVLGLVGVAALLDGKIASENWLSDEPPREAGATVAVEAGAPEPSALAQEVAVTPSAASKNVALTAAPNPDARVIAPEEGVSLLAENVSGRPGSEIPLNIAVELEHSDKSTFLMLRGLPEQFKMSAGFPLKNFWAVSLQDYGNLKLVPAEGYEGDLELEVLLIRGGNVPVARQVMTVSVKEPDAVGNDPARATHVKSADEEAAPVPPSLGEQPSASEDKGAPDDAGLESSLPLDKESPSESAAPAESSLPSEAASPSEPPSLSEAAPSSNVPLSSETTSNTEGPGSAQTPKLAGTRQASETPLGAESVYASETLSTAETSSTLIAAVPPEFNASSDTSPSSEPGSTSLAALPPKAAPASEPPLSKEPLAPPDAFPTKLLITPENEAALLERGLKLLDQGDIVSARLMLEHLARRGSGKGALALAETYDPILFRSLHTLGGVKPDRKKAEEWYARAVRLGVDGARNRLNILSGQ